MKHHRNRLHHKANRVCPAVCLAGMLAAYTSAAADEAAFTKRDVLPSRQEDRAAIGGFESPVPFPLFKAGDRVAFLGDSITASGEYVPLIRLFYATRFPDRPVRLYNCGIGGANAASSWKRIEPDCLDLDPTAVVVNLGMNDAGTAASRSVIDRYQSYMTRVMDRVTKDANRRLALVVPSAYDQTAAMQAKSAVGKNDTIRTFGEWLVEQSRERRVPLIDFNTPMLRINAKRQVDDPAFSVIGPDRIHPGVNGHTVMMYAFVRAQGIPGPVARVEINAVAGSAKALNASVREVETDKGKVSFVYTPQALPYPAEAIPFESPEQEWVPFTEDLNREWLVVRGLKTGRWALSIDGEPVGEFSADDMAGGIDLAREPRSPGYRQAHEVFAVANEIETAERNLRAIARCRWLVLESRGIDLDDTERAVAAVRNYVARIPQHTYWQSRAEIFYRLCAPEKREAERVRMENLMTKLYEINKPKPQRVVLRHEAHERPSSG